VVRRETAVRVFSLGKRTSMLATMADIQGAVVRGATCRLCMSLFLCQELARSQVTRRVLRLVGRSVRRARDGVILKSTTTKGGLL
jgi:hypothetical protein